MADRFKLEIPLLSNYPHLINYLEVNLMAAKDPYVYNSIMKCLVLFFSEQGFDIRKTDGSFLFEVPKRHIPGKQVNLFSGGSIHLTQARAKELIDVLNEMFNHEFFLHCEIHSAAQHSINEKVMEIKASQSLRRNLTNKALMSLYSRNIIKPAIESFIDKYNLVGTKKSYEALKKYYYRERKKRNAA